MRHKLVYKNSASFIYINGVCVSVVVVTVKPFAQYISSVGMAFAFVLENVGMAIIFHFWLYQNAFSIHSGVNVCVCIICLAWQNLQHPCRCVPHAQHQLITIYTLVHSHTHLTHTHTFSFLHLFNHSFIFTHTAHSFDDVCMEDQHPLYRCPICIYIYIAASHLWLLRNRSILCSLFLSTYLYTWKTHNKSNNWIKMEHNKTGDILQTSCRLVSFRVCLKFIFVPLGWS